MEARDEALDAALRRAGPLRQAQGAQDDLEVCEVVSAEPIAEAPVESVAQAVPGVAVAIDASAPHRNGKLKHVIECMLFVSNEPVTAAHIAEALEIEPDRVEDALASLEEDLNCGHGVQLARVAGGYQICTRPEFGEYCAMILQPAKRKLSKAALETLAVIAYRQPCTIPEIEAVRGVNVDGVIKTLTERGLIRETGRKQAPGRPILYATTEEFLEYFGLNDISELPDIDMLAVEEVKALDAERELHIVETPAETDAAAG
jgi:segregation and condensation protein B